MASRNKKNPDVENRVAHLEQSGKLSVITTRNALIEVGNKVNFQETGVLKKPIITHKEQSLIKPLKLEEKHPKGLLTRKVVPKAAIAGVKRQDTALPTKISKKLLSYSSKQLDVLDVDAFDKDNPFLVAEYIQDIYAYLLSLEAKMNIKKGFLQNHRSTPTMRSVLINWMVDVHLNFSFFAETLHLSVAIIDRYLQENVDIGSKTLQLVGTASLLLAAKYEEIYAPNISDFVYICDDTFSRHEIFKMERKILQGLEFNLGRPLSVHFLKRFNKILCVTVEHHNLGKYLLELGLLQYDLCYIDPSIQAAAACCLSLAILNDLLSPEAGWTNTIVHYTTYKYEKIRATVVKFAVTLTKAETMTYKAIRKKYAEDKFLKISMNSKLNGRLVKKLTAKAICSKT